ncbi:hypothetical protein ACFWPQ_46460 [Streptomyces sp. NPDC058464]|uniref:hypothetical protein n=1 Tax=Streptomyces sp. NPDC058464 TaxID=3346511 RepID=UPI0036655D90
MRIAMALMVLMLVLGSVSAVGHARKGRWAKAAEVFLPVLGGNLVLFGGVEQHLPPLFWLGALLVVTGLGIEVLSLWRARTAEQRQKTSG